MNRVVDKRYKKLQKIYKTLIENGLIEEGTIINYDAILRDLYYINLLLFQTYKIFSESSTKQIKIEKISQLTDPSGNKLFNKSISKKIVELYEKPFMDTMNKIKRRRIKNVANEQQGGGHIDYANNKIDDFINELGANKKLIKSVGKLASSVKKIKKSTGLDFDDIADAADFGEQIINKAASIGPNIAMSTGENIFNWIFFPLYQLENLPLIGFMFEIPLDIIGVLFDNTDVLMEFIAPLIPLGMDLATGSVSVIPGVGSGAAAVGLGLAFLEKPIEWLFADGLDVVGIYLNIQRKQWGLAYLSLMEVIPQLPSIVDMVVTNMYTMNKHLKKVTIFTQGLRDTAKVGSVLSSAFLVNPMIMFQPENIWEEVIYPNRDIIPILNKVPFEKIEKLAPVLAAAYSTFKSTKASVDKLTNKFLDQKKAMEEDNREN